MRNKKGDVKSSNEIRKQIEMEFYASTISDFRREEVEENFYK